jgi:hypothetical protein
MLGDNSSLIGLGKPWAAGSITEEGTFQQRAPYSAGAGIASGAYRILLFLVESLWLKPLSK